MLFIDIETIPHDPESWMVPDVSTLEPPANYKKTETIEAWRAEKAATQVAELREKSSLEPLLGGTILCVGIAVDAGPVNVLVAPSGDETGERILLERFEKGLMKYPSHPLVAWRGVGFDFPFLAKRGLRHGLFTLSRRCFVQKPWGSPMHVDPFLAWQGPDHRALGRLRQVAQFLGHDSPDNLDGSEVARAFAEGRLDEIKAHASEDVRLLREVDWWLREAGWLVGEDEVPDREVRPPRITDVQRRHELMILCAGLQVTAAKQTIQAAAIAAGIPWVPSVEAGEGQPAINEATTLEQLRAFYAGLQRVAA